MQAIVPVAVRALIIVGKVLSRFWTVLISFVLVAVGVLLVGRAFVLPALKDRDMKWQLAGECPDAKRQAYELFEVIGVLTQTDSPRQVSRESFSRIIAYSWASSPCLRRLAYEALGYVRQPEMVVDARSVLRMSAADPEPEVRRQWPISAYTSRLPGWQGVLAECANSPDTEVSGAAKAAIAAARIKKEWPE